MTVDSFEVKVANNLTINGFETDLQHRVQVFPDDLADALRLHKQPTILTELAFNAVPVDSDSRRSLVKIILSQIFRSEPHLPAVDKWIDQFTKDLASSELLEQSRFLSTGKPNFFEALVRLALFSPLPEAEVLQLLFKALNNLDLTPAFLKVKLTHVEFLVWYLLRLSLSYLPYSEVSQAVRKAAFGKETHVVSATVTSLDTSDRPSLAVTDLFRIWFLVAYRTGVTHIKLGSNGTLDKLKEALMFWIGEHMGNEFALGRMNELRIILNVRGKLVKWETRFDEQMRLILPYGNPETPIEGSHVIVMEDSDHLIDLVEFKRILQSFSVIRDILNRSHSVSTGAWNLDASLAKNIPTDINRLSIKCNLNLNTPTEEIRLGYVELKDAPQDDIIEEANTSKVDHLLYEKTRFFFAKGLLPSVLINVRSPQKKSLKELVALALKRLKLDLVNHGMGLQYGSGFKYSDQSLELLKAQPEFAKVLVTARGERKASKTNEITAEDVWNHFQLDRNHTFAPTPGENSKVLELDIVFEQRQLRQVCSYLTRDYYTMGGITLASDQLVPCQLSNKNDHFGDILYENTGSLWSQRQDECGS